MDTKESNVASLAKCTAPLDLNDPELRILVCPQCKTELGKHTNTVLYISLVHFVRPEIFYCNACSSRIRWRPLPQE